MAIAMIRPASRLASAHRLARAPLARGVTALTLGQARRLDDVVKLELLQKEPAPAIRQIWEAYHQDAPACVALTLDAEAHARLRERLQESPMFVTPVPREGGYFVLAVQHQQRSLCFTYLEEYNKSPHTAQPWLFATVYDELVADKGLALARGEFAPHLLSKPEAQRALERLLAVYTSDRYDRAWIFNHAPAHFDFEAYVQAELEADAQMAKLDAAAQ